MLSKILSFIDRLWRCSETKKLELVGNKFGRLFNCSIYFRLVFRFTISDWSIFNTPNDSCASTHKIWIILWVIISSVTHQSDWNPMKAVITGFKLTDIHKKMKKEAKKKEWIHFPRIKYDSYYIIHIIWLVIYYW